MKNFWNGFAKVATLVALWAAAHPDVIVAVINANANKKT